MGKPYKFAVPDPTPIVLTEDERELLRNMCRELARIADALESQATDRAAAVATDADPCAHPEQARVDLGGDDFECAKLRGGCGRRFLDGEWQEA